MFKKPLIFVLTYLFLSTSALAVPIALDSFTAISSGKVIRDDFISSPTAMNYSEDLEGTYEIGLLRVGIGGAFRFINHMSDVIPSVGNIRGNRWELFPVIAIPAFPILGTELGVYLEPILFTGRYSLSNKTIINSDVSYDSPIGARLFITYDFFSWSLFDNIGGALMFDYTAYRNFDDSRLGEGSLTRKLKIWSLGLGIHLSIN